MNQNQAKSNSKDCSFGNWDFFVKSQAGRKDLRFLKLHALGVYIYN